MNKLMTNCSLNENKPKTLFGSRLFVLQSLVFLLMLINAFRANTVPGSLILGVAMLVPFFLKPTEIAAYIVGFCMMGTGIQTAYIALACMVALLFKCRTQINATALISIAIFATYELIHNVIYVDDDLVESVRFIVVYALLFYILFMSYEVRDKLRIVHSYIYGTVFSILHIFVEMAIAFNGDLTKFVDGTVRFGYAEQLEGNLTMSADPNLVGQSCSFVIVLCAALIMLGYKNKLYYASLFLALLAGTLTISKTFLISLVLIVILTILFAGSFNSAQTLLKRLGLVFLVFLGVFIIMKLNPTYIDNIMSRVDENDITTGRVRIAGRYIEYLMNEYHSFFIGVGMQNVGPKIGLGASPHMALIEGIICWGLIGFIAMIVVIIKSVLVHTSKVKVQIINFVPMMVFLFLIQSTQLFRLRSRLFALLVFIIFSSIPQKGDKRNESEKESTTDN